MSNPRERPSTKGWYYASAGGTARLVLASLLLHAAAAIAALTLLRLPPLAPAIDPPRIEVLFGHASTPGPAAAPAAAPGAPATPDGVGPPAAASQGGPAAKQASAQDTAGLRVDEPDPTMIPATDDPGNAAPAYPDAARRGHIQGTVLIRLHIDAAGGVSWVETRQSSGDATLDEAAEIALAHWHFRPARQHGQPVASYRDQPVRFAIE